MLFLCKRFLEISPRRRLRLINLCSRLLWALLGLRWFSIWRLRAFFFLFRGLYRLIIKVFALLGIIINFETVFTSSQVINSFVYHLKLAQASRSFSRFYAFLTLNDRLGWRFRLLLCLTSSRCCITRFGLLWSPSLWRFLLLYRCTFCTSRSTCAWNFIGLLLL